MPKMKLNGVEVHYGKDKEKEKKAESVKRGSPKGAKSDVKIDK